MADDVLFDDVEKEDFLVYTFPPDEAYVKRTFTTLEKAHTFASKAAWNPLLIHRKTSIVHRFLEI